MENLHIEFNVDQIALILAADTQMKKAEQTGLKFPTLITFAHRLSHAEESKRRLKARKSLRAVSLWLAPQFDWL
jgi:hypothetical protein